MENKSVIQFVKAKKADEMKLYSEVRLALLLDKDLLP